MLRLSGDTESALDAIMANTGLAPAIEAASYSTAAAPGLPDAFNSFAPVGYEPAAAVIESGMAGAFGLNAESITTPEARPEVIGFVGPAPEAPSAAA